MKIAKGVNCKQGITRIINKTLSSKKINYSHYDYAVDIFSNGRHKAQLITDENNNKLRNISLVFLNTKKAFGFVKAAIGNKTGNIAVVHKPWWMKLKTAEKKVEQTINNSSTHPLDMSVEASGSNSVFSAEVLDFYKNL